VLACGRRFGKTTLGIRALAVPALDGLPVAWFSPTYKMLTEVWRETRRLLYPVIKSQDKQQHRLELVTGGVVDMWSLETPEAPRGRKYARVVVDEAAMAPDLGDTWQAAIRPTLTDFRGDGWFLSTPKGANFFRAMYAWGQDPAMPDWASWRLPTTANPFIDPEEVETARKELPERVFAQEYLAEFLEDAGGVFRYVRRQATAPRRAADDRELIVMGLDWGQAADFTVIVAINARTRRMVDMDRFNQVDWALQRARVKAMAEKWRPAVIMAEANSIGGPNIEALQREGLPVVGFDTTSASKPPLIESLALAFERDELKIFDDPVLIGELEAYERTVSEVTGRPRYNAPAGMHDDTVMALALAWHAVLHGQRSRTRRAA